MYLYHFTRNQKLSKALPYQLVVCHQGGSTVVVWPDSADALDTQVHMDGLDQVETGEVVVTEQQITDDAKWNVCLVGNVSAESASPCTFKEVRHDPETLLTKHLTRGQIQPNRTELSVIVKRY